MTTKEKEAAFLANHVFQGLENLNYGFDAPVIKYFSKKDFETVLLRVQNLGIGIYGIEPWPDGKFEDVKGYCEYGLSPFDPNWYQQAFKDFIAMGVTSHFTATYKVPAHLLNDSKTIPSPDRKI